MADGPDERLVAGLRHLVGDLRDWEKFGYSKDPTGLPLLTALCLVCDRCYGCHSGWRCPTDKDLHSSERGECVEGCSRFRKGKGEDSA